MDNNEEIELTTEYLPEHRREPRYLDAKELDERWTKAGEHLSELKGVCKAFDEVKNLRDIEIQRAYKSFPHKGDIHIHFAAALEGAMNAIELLYKEIETGEQQ